MFNGLGPTMTESGGSVGVLPKKEKRFVSRVPKATNNLVCGAHFFSFRFRSSI